MSMLLTSSCCDCDKAPDTDVCCLNDGTCLDPIPDEGCPGIILPGPCPTDEEEPCAPAGAGSCGGCPEKGECPGTISWTATGRIRHAICCTDPNHDFCCFYWAFSGGGTLFGGGQLCEYFSDVNLPGTLNLIKNTLVVPDCVIEPSITFDTGGSLQCISLLRGCASIGIPPAFFYALTITTGQISPIGGRNWGNLNQCPAGLFVSSSTFGNVGVCNDCAGGSLGSLAFGVG